MASYGGNLCSTAACWTCCTIRGLYAGGYVYGRTQTRVLRTLPNETRRGKGRTRRVAPGDWPIVRHDAHPGYISWEQFLRNQQRLDDNCTSGSGQRRGACLEQCLVARPRLMRKMWTKDECAILARRTRTQLRMRSTSQTTRRPCLSIRTWGYQPWAVCSLEAIQPAHLEVSLATLGAIEDEQEVERQWQLRLERARYEADLARRRFVAVDPENRLVARNLEKDWNEKLAVVEQLKRDQTQLSSPAATSAVARTAAS